jgi:glycolate oxidase iron-sulfur subunit
MLEGCVTRVLFHPANEATMRVLQRAGCTVLAPAAMGCCGALHLHAGFAEEARAKMRRLVDALKGEMFDALIVNSAGCGSTLKEIGEILKDDDAYAEPAAEIARKVRDVCEFLAEMEQPTFTGTFNEVTAYHDACHLCHGQKITAQPRELLRRVPGLTLVDLPESDTCCGSAGIYNLTQPQMAQQLLQRKIDHIRGTGATVIATGNPGCTAWIRKGCDDAGLKVRVMHPIEILDAAMR